MSLSSVVDVGLRLIAVALVVFGILVLVMTVVASPSSHEAPRWVHVLSAVPFFCAATLFNRLGSIVRRARSD